MGSDQRLIGLAGKAGVGKSTIARNLYWRVPAKVFSFATPLKKAASTLTGLDISHFIEIEKKEAVIPWIGKSPRQILQLLGTEFGRQMLHEDFWTRRMGQEIEKFKNNHESFAELGMPVGDLVIDDIRFENEAQFVRDNGGLVIHLRRVHKKVTEHTGHASEKGLEVKEGDLVHHLIQGDPVEDGRQISYRAEEIFMERENG